METLRKFRRMRTVYRTKWRNCVLFGVVPIMLILNSSGFGHQYNKTDESPGDSYHNLKISSPHDFNRINNIRNSLFSSLNTIRDHPYEVHDEVEHDGEVD